MIAGEEHPTPAKPAHDLEWFKEFIRVETDKFLLFALLLVLMHFDPGGGDMKMVLGALLMAIQNNRYARVPPGKSGADAASKV